MGVMTPTVELPLATPSTNQVMVWLVLLVTVTE